MRETIIGTARACNCFTDKYSYSSSRGCNYLRRVIMEAVEDADIRVTRGTDSNGGGANIRATRSTII